MTSKLFSFCDYLAKTSQCSLKLRLTLGHAKDTIPLNTSVMGTLWNSTGFLAKVLESFILLIHTIISPKAKVFQLC